MDALPTTSTSVDSGSYTSCDDESTSSSLESPIVGVQYMLMPLVVGTLNVIFLDFRKQISLNYQIVMQAALMLTIMIVVKPVNDVCLSQSLRSVVLKLSQVHVNCQV